MSKKYISNSNSFIDAKKHICITKTCFYILKIIWVARLALRRKLCSRLLVRLAVSCIGVIAAYEWARRAGRLSSHGLGRRFFSLHMCSLLYPRHCILSLCGSVYGFSSSRERAGFLITLHCTLINIKYLQIYFDLKVTKTNMLNVKKICSQ